MYSHTCAHKELPFGTRLSVTNTANFKNSECIVNDRGPFVAGRDLDLSYAVAKEIGLIAPGTGRVMIEILGRDDSYVKKVKVETREKSGPFVIQVGSFTEGVNAIRLKTALSLEYNNVRVDETDVDGTKYYRVRIGNYREWKQTVDVAEKLGQEGYQAVVLKTDSEI